MDAITCIESRRSIRSFDQSRPVSHETIERIVAAAAFAPSWKNTQITRYIALESEAKEKLAQCTNIWPKNGDIIRSASAVIAVTFVSGRSGYERDGSFSTPLEDRWQYFDTGIATEAFLLAAHTEGVGSVVLGLYDDNAADVIGVPEGQKLVALIPIGYHTDSPACPPRKTAADLLSYRS
ncbi:MAG: nitroreductase family protein [Lachnospiraceae bacterium]|nr:nitroreductase family protein [Lachnospiraceae bacterium]